jgi:hypothetical protein
MDDTFFEDDFDPDETDQDDCGDCEEEPEELDFDQGKEESVTEHEYLDPFWLGVAAGFGYEMGKEERKKKKK